MPDVVLFDLFGVIARNQTPDAVNGLAAIARVPVPAFVDAYWRHLAVHYERHHDRWLRHFEVVAFSCRLGVAKPDAEAFLRCCDVLGVTPDRVLFVDDRAENTHAAGRLGMHTHRFTGPAAAGRAIDSHLRRLSA